MTRYGISGSTVIVTLISSTKIFFDLINGGINVFHIVIYMMDIHNSKVKKNSIFLQRIEEPKILHIK